MTNEVTALVVEDDLDMRDEIEDGLAVLGHGHHWAQSQQEAYELIQRTHYDYVLVDLEIPARTGRGFAKIEYGKKLISQIQRAKGRGRIPVVVMTAHHMHGLNLARELLIHGAMEFLSKPFGDVGNGKSLPETVQNVLDAHRKLFPRGALPGDPPEQFRGGTLAFYPDHIELAGEAILEEDGPGHAWQIMQVLRQPRPNGGRTRLSAPRLAKTVDPSGQVTAGAINSCVHALRERICQTMLANANVTVGRDDVVANLGKGYHLAEWLGIEDHDDDPENDNVHAPSHGHEACTSTRPRVDIPPDVHASPRDVPLTDRQQWVLERLRDGAKMRRAMVEQEFEIGRKQASRVLNPLVRRGLIEFMRKPRPGHYRLVKEA